MFKSLFVYPAVVNRHQEGPLGAERIAYLESLVARGVAHATLLRHANYCLAVAEAVDRAPRAVPSAPWSAAEVDALAVAWARQRVDLGRATAQRWPHDHFYLVAVEFLGRRASLPPARPDPWRGSWATVIPTPT